jgi:hypothetical protein
MKKNKYSSFFYQILTIVATKEFCGEITKPCTHNLQLVEDGQYLVEETAVFVFLHNFKII